MFIRDYVFERKHREYRRDINVNMAEEFKKRGFDTKERTTRVFEWVMKEEIPVILENEKICFLRTIKKIPECYTPEEYKEITGQYDYYSYPSNYCPNYAKAIEKGLLELKKGADEYAKRMIDAVIDLSDRYKAEAERIGRTDIAKNLEQVPRYGAKTFAQALQIFRILYFALRYEGSNHITLGRFDQYMYPYYKSDIEKGILTEASALELLEDFFVSFNKDSDLYPGVQEGDNGQSMVLGGIDGDGNDVFNELSSLCLKASYNNKMIDPKINLRVGKNTPPARYTEATTLTKAGLGFPQYSNEEIVIPALEKLGYEPSDAVDYVVAACWEFIIPKVGTDIPNIDAVSYPTAVDAALHKYLESCADYDEFFGYVCNELNKETERICSKWKRIYVVPAPFMNLLMDCDIYDGGKYNNFGLHGAGISTAADSLAAIKKYVFETKEISATEIIRAVDNNFDGYPELLHKLRYETPKLGNNDDFVDDIAVKLLDAFSKSLEGKKNSLGGIYRAGTGSAMFYLWKANEIGASADGRLKGEPFGANFSVSLFANVKGPVSVIASMTKPHFERAINGGPLTLEFHSSVFSESDGVQKVGALVKSFIDNGGHQIQLNTVNREELLDAQKHPEKHKHLVVRVWGWSAYFVDLDKEWQDHIIARQEYSV